MGEQAETAREAEDNPVIGWRGRSGDSIDSASS